MKKKIHLNGGFLHNARDEVEQESEWDDTRGFFAFIRFSHLMKSLTCIKRRFCYLGASRIDGFPVLWTENEALEIELLHGLGS